MLLSRVDAGSFFASLAHIVIDEAHALAGTKRGDQLALCLARLAVIAAGASRIGLSATVADIDRLRAYVGRGAPASLIEAPPGAAPDIRLLLPEARVPWSGRMGLAGASAILARIRDARMTIVFVNTRAQAELLFQAIWRLNDETLPIALHHGSLDIAQRRRVEAAMSLGPGAKGGLRAVIATSSLDLGIDWGGIDQVIQVGAPKGVSRLLQRVGRANHRMDESSHAVLAGAWLGSSRTQRGRAASNPQVLAQQWRHVWSRAAPPARQACGRALREIQGMWRASACATRFARGCFGGAKPSGHVVACWENKDGAGQQRRRCNLHVLLLEGRASLRLLARPYELKY